jgi:prephenate dehydrogenase
MTNPNQPTEQSSTEQSSTYHNSQARRVGIIGLGLIGGSIALSLSGKFEVAGYDTDSATTQTAQNMGIATAPNINDIISFADIIMVCTPIAAFPDIVQLLASSSQGYANQPRSKAPIVADTCSVKRYIHKWAEQLEGAGIRFVGTHPMAGKHTSGIRYAQADLFMDHSWAVSITDSTDLAALLEVSAIILSAGSTLVPVAPDTHDRSVALVSHLPHVIAAVMLKLLQVDGLSPLDRSLAAGSFNDITRVAGSPPDLSSQMCAANIDMLSESFQRFRAEIELIGIALGELESAPYALSDLFTHAHNAYSGMSKGMSKEAGDINGIRDSHGAQDVRRTGEPQYGAPHSAMFILDDPQTLTNWMLGLGRDGGRIVGIGYPGPGEIAISFVLPDQRAS